MARSSRVKLEALKQVLTMLRLTNEPEKLPIVVQEMIRQLAVPNVVIAFAFQPLTGNLVNVSNSALPPKPEAYSQVANAASRVAQIFQSKAMEVMQSVSMDKPEGVEGTQKTRTNSKSRDGSTDSQSRVDTKNDVDTPIDDTGKSVSPAGAA